MVKPIFLKHYREKDGDKILNNGGMTIAVGCTDTGLAFMAISRCHPTDNFSRKLGRVRAEGKLNSKKFSYNLGPRACIAFGTIDDKFDYLKIAAFCNQVNECVKSRKEDSVSACIEFAKELLDIGDLPF